MLTRFTSFLILLPIVAFGFCSSFIVKNDHLPSIEIKYVGPSNKPLPAVVLYIDNNFDTLSRTFTHFFKIDQKDFDSIALHIDNNSCLVGVDRQKIHFKFSVDEYGLNGFILTMNKSSSEKKIADILEFLHDNDVKKRMKNVLADILDRTP